MSYQALLSGQTPGLRAAALRAALRVAEVPYCAAVSWRNRRYDRGRATVFRPPVPVISVGNLTVGGTGKTPLVEWIARTLRKSGVRVAILSRGYGAEAGRPNDEALELELALPDVPHLQAPDRAASARVAVEELEMQALVLDDGFQHRRLARDLDIVLLDALQPFGYGHVLPRGLLREPISSLARADVIVLSRADLVEEPTRRQIEAEARRHAPDATMWCEIRHAPRELASAGGTREPWQAFSGRKVAAICGIGNPTGFEKTLKACGMDPIAFRRYPDHHAYTREDVADLITWAAGTSAEVAICTRKDLVKLQFDALGPVPLRALEVQAEFLRGEAELESQLARVTSGS